MFEVYSLIAGIAIGLSLAVPPGPMNALIAAESVKRSYMDGIKLGQQLLQVQPDLLIILSTGYSGMITEDAIHAMGFRGLLVKPTTARTLGEEVHRALHAQA